MFNYDDRVGQKVLAIHTINNDEKYIQIFGRGKLLGAFYPDTAIGPTADEVRADGEGARNAKIELNTGEIVWGCECWWMEGHRGDMWLMELASLGYVIHEASIDDMRRLYLEVKNGQRG